MDPFGAWVGPERDHPPVTLSCVNLMAASYQLIRVRECLARPLSSLHNNTGSNTVLTLNRVHIVMTQNEMCVQYV